MSTNTLSVCMIVKNEEGNLPRSLKSLVSVAQEIVVVDTGSTDKTVEIAESFGAKVFHHPWKGDFAEARNASLDRATGSWILVLDADEVVSQDLAEALPKAMDREGTDAYLATVVNMLDGGTTTSGFNVRLFRNKPGYRYVGSVHESVEDSIIAAGGKIEFLPQTVEHYGYTEAESRRKGRRQRNMALLRSRLEAEPNQSGLWFYMGQEYLCLGEYGQGAEHFRTSLGLAHEGARSVDAAHRLLEVEFLRQRLTDGWELANMGADIPLLRWDSLFWTAKIASFEGDYLALQECIGKLRDRPDDQPTRTPLTPAVLEGFEADGLWEADERTSALKLWEKLVAENPAHHDLANQWVRHRVLAEGLQTAVSAATKAHPTPQVLSACAGALMRTGEYGLAATLSRNSLQWHHTSPYFMHAMGYAGMWNDIEGIVDMDEGVDAALHFATAALWFGDDEVVRRAMDRLTGSWRTAFETIMSGELIPADLLWAVDILMSVWADIGCMPLLLAGARGLDSDQSVGAARAAWLLMRAGSHEAALDLALGVQDQPDAQEVIGLLSHEMGEHQAAAHFLLQRVSAGPATVRVYRSAIDSLLAIGSRSRARTVLELGLKHRPRSSVLRKLAKRD